MPDFQLLFLLLIMEENKHHFQYIMQFYFKESKNATRVLNRYGSSNADINRIPIRKHLKFIAGTAKRKFCSNLYKK